MLAGATAGLTALVPTWRRDIAIEADVAEEIARVRGYELVPSVTPDTAMPTTARRRSRSATSSARRWPAPA